jgi:ATPase family associated with various cellular activities (AAA)/Winged helix domain, variant
MSSLTEASPELGFAALDARIRAAVEGVAATDPNPADPFRGLYISDAQALALAGETPEGGIDERIARAAERLGLDELETAVLALCAAPELNPRYGRLFAYLHDDVTRKLASPRLIARLLDHEGASEADVFHCFARDSALRRAAAIQLVEAAPQTPLADRLVKVSDRLAAFVLGEQLDEPLRSGLRRQDVSRHDIGRAETIAELRSLLARESRMPLVVAGPDADALLAAALGRPLLVMDAMDAVEPDALHDATITAALEGRVVCFEGLEGLEPEKRRRVQRALAARDARPLICAATAAVVVVLGGQTVLVVEAPLPSIAERRAVWASLTDAEIDDVAAKFRLSVRQIVDAAEVARLVAAASNKNVSPAELDRGARQASSTQLAELAARLEPAFGWDDLVLPDHPRDVLRSISAYLRHRDLVLSEWGYDRTVARTQGLKVLFAGESGTGKTMAGQVLARELGLDLFRIDLATVVSKYIGETEKNLDRIFDAAEGSNAILFFDEADALFGKRSEVHDAHDRYANIEVAYLLQKMEAYPGAVILATNFRQNMDDAFLRRLDVVVDFPFPEADDRERIWRLVLPHAAPVAGDVDVSFLANRFKLSGGGIRNCSLAAAFLAADEHAEIRMEHLIRAVALEYGKLGRLTLEADFEHFHELIRPQAGVPMGDRRRRSDTDVS